MPRAILFGFEGGLIDPVGPRLEAFSSVLAEEGIELSESLLGECPFTPPYEEWLASLIASVRGRAEPALLPRLMARAAARYRGVAKPVWLDGLVELADRAAAEGVALGVVTSLAKGEVALALAEAGLEERFKLVVGPEDLEGPDSRSAAYREALRLLNSEPPLPERLIHPHEVASVEATAEGVRAAAEVGLVTVGVGSALAEGPEPDLHVDSLVELELSRLDSG